MSSVSRNYQCSAPCAAADGLPVDRQSEGRRALAFSKSVSLNPFWQKLFQTSWEPTLMWRFACKICSGDYFWNQHQGTFNKQKRRKGNIFNSDVLATRLRQKPRWGLESPRVSQLCSYSRQGEQLLSRRRLPYRSSDTSYPREKSVLVTADFCRLWKLPAKRLPSASCSPKPGSGRFQEDWVGRRGPLWHSEQF